jgi:hypothetical protein
LESCPAIFGSRFRLLIEGIVEVVNEQAEQIRMRGHASEDSGFCHQVCGPLGFPRLLL